jgi:hypothetical protein
MKSGRRVWRELGGGGLHHGRDKAVLVGNGPNLLSGRLSWACLLNDLSSALVSYPLSTPGPTSVTASPSAASSIRTRSNSSKILKDENLPLAGSKDGDVGLLVVDDAASKPLSMVYEELYLAAMRRNGPRGMKETQVKRVIADMVRRQLRPNDFHHRLMTTSGCRHVLTTNYDYNLEEACTGGSASVVHAHVSVRVGECVRSNSSARVRQAKWNRASECRSSTRPPTPCFEGTRCRSSKVSILSEIALWLSLSLSLLEASGD